LPAFAEYLTEGQNALLVPPCSALHLAEALLALAREGPDEVCAKLGDGAARNRSLYLSWDELATRTLALYQDLRRCSRHAPNCGTQVR
jgi:glycosyltransferase involved in cell wall biosynthesis